MLPGCVCSKISTPRMRAIGRSFHARFGLGEDLLPPYKKTIDRWLWPDIFRGQEASVSRAKEAITQYKKAVGDPEGLAELMVFYCEQGSGFLWGCRPHKSGILRRTGANVRTSAQSHLRIGNQRPE